MSNGIVDYLIFDKDPHVAKEIIRLHDQHDRVECAIWLMALPSQDFQDEIETDSADYHYGLRAEENRRMNLDK